MLVEDGLCVRGEEIHREVDALESAPFDREITRLRRSGANHGGVEFAEQFFRGQIFSDLDAADELHSFAFEHLEPAHHDLLLVELHVRDAVHEQPARTVGALIDGDEMPRPVELRGGGKTGGAGTDDRDFFSRALLGNLRPDPAFLPAFVNDRGLDVLDRDGRRIDAEHARTLARRGTHAARELGKIVRLVQPLKRLAPQAAVD